jgi:hypothetical protein
MTTVACPVSLLLSCPVLRSPTKSVPPPPPRNHITIQPTVRHPLVASPSAQRPAPSAQRPVCLCLFPYAPPTSARALTPALCACGQDRPADLPSPLCYYLYNTCPLDDIYAPRRKKKEIYYPSVPTGNQQSRSPFCRTCSTC